MPNPISIYLDLNHWISLARAAHGRPNGAPFSAVLDALRSAASAGRVILPLSWFHFLETQQAHRPARRQRLARTMVELSRGATIAPLSALVAQQMTQSVARACGIVRVSSKPTVFGVGVSHAVGQPRQSIWEGLADFDEPILAGDSTGLTEEQERTSQSTIEELRRRHDEQAATQEDGRAWARADGGDAIRRYHLARCGVDFLASINEGARECGVVTSPGDPIHQEWLSDIILGVPELSVRIALSELRDRQHHRRVAANDFRDIDALAAAIPHCDVVVTEKFWTALAAQAGLERRFGTRVLADLRQLPAAMSS